MSDLNIYQESGIDFYEYFDYYINISTDHITLKQGIINDSQSLNVFLEQIVHYIKLAVGDRLVLVQHKPYDCWVKFVTIGLKINPEKAFDIVTLGPLANHPDALAFRDLWGQKAEIRRFQNGDIREAVYWDCKSYQDRRNIILEAIKYILNKKLQIKFKYITSTFAYLDRMLELPNIKFDDNKLHYGTGEDFNNMINQSMVTLKRYLHQINNLTFNIVEVIEMDPVFRSTEVFPVFPVNSKAKKSQNFCNIFDLNEFNDKLRYIRPIEIILKIEVDTKQQQLVTNLEAIQNQKYIFHYELGRSVAKSYNLFVHPSCEHLDIFFNGYVFRIIITLHKEVTIHRELANKVKAVRSVENSLVDQLEFQTQVLPAISSCLNTLSKTNNSYSLTCRLFKRWLSIQMINNFFNDITLDLLVAYAFLHFSNTSENDGKDEDDDDCHQPNSLLAGFLRVLKFMSEFNFSENALILNFNKSYSMDKINDIKASFVAERSRLPPIFIVTSYDRKLSQHTRTKPNALVVYHVKKLSHTLLLNLKSSLSNFKIDDIKTFLKPNLSMFDIVIHLNTKAIFNKFQSIEFPADITIKQSLYSDEQKHVMPITDFNPVSIYLTSLQKAYSRFALFFYDQFGGRKIGVLLRPETLESKPFKYSTIEGSMLTNSSYSHFIDNVALNMQALVEDFEIIGAGLVEKVVVQSEKLVNK